MFAEKLKKLRIEAGLSQRDVANKLGYSTPQFISNWERGISRPPVSALGTISSLYGESLDSLYSYCKADVLAEAERSFKIEFNKHYPKNKKY